MRAYLKTKEQQHKPRSKRKTKFQWQIEPETKYIECIQGEKTQNYQKNFYWFYNLAFFFQAM